MLGGLNVTMLNLNVHVQNRHDDTFWQWQLVHGLIYLHFTKHILNTPQRKCTLIERVQSAQSEPRSKSRAWSTRPEETWWAGPCLPCGAGHFWLVGFIYLVVHVVSDWVLGLGGNEEVTGNHACACTERNATRIRFRFSTGSSSSDLSSACHAITANLKYINRITLSKSNNHLTNQEQIKTAQSTVIKKCFNNKHTEM